MMFFGKLIRDEAGATAIEYGLIVALIAIVLVGSLEAVGGGFGNTLNTASTTMGN